MTEKLRVKSVIEVVGTPENFVKEAMDIVMQKLQERKDIKMLEQERFGTTKIENKPFWSTFCDLELEVNDVDVLLNYCVEFLPSSVDIVEPVGFQFQNYEINRLFNDIIARLHEYHMSMKNMQAENILLKRDMAKLKEPAEKK